LVTLDRSEKGYQGIKRETVRAIKEAELCGVKIAALFPGLHALPQLKRSFRYYVIARNLKQLLDGFIELYFSFSS